MLDQDNVLTEDKVKILVGYHKPSLLFKNNILVPIHLGREVVNEVSKDGATDQSGKQWLSEHLIGDNTGDNISLKNRSYNEMTALYWAWKNLDQLNQPEYIGFMHYRRQFIFDDKMKVLFNQFPFEAADSQFRIDTLSEEAVSILFNEQTILQALAYQDAIIPRGIKQSITVYEQYLAASGHAHQIRDLDVMLTVIKELFPEFYPVTAEYMNGYTHYWWNMTVMRQELFASYCAFLFGVLEKTQEYIDILEPSMTPRTVMQKRIYGFLSERLTGIYITYLKSQAGLRLAEKYSILEMFTKK